MALVRIQDTIQLANGDAAPNGTANISWTSFTSASGQQVIQGNRQFAVIGGVIDLYLQANIGATPSGTSYKVMWDFPEINPQPLEYWNVPATGPVNLAAIRTIVSPSPSPVIAASQIIYTPPGTGAIARTVQSRLQDFVSVKDFGALGVDTDDTAAIQAAINSVQATNGTIYIPSGTYRISSQLTITNSIEIMGAGMQSTFIKKTADVVGILIKSGATYTKMSGFNLTSTASTGTSDGIVVGDADNTNGAGECVFRDMACSSHKGSGINVRNGNSGVLDHVSCIGNSQHGVLISSQHPVVDNTNAWRLFAVTAGSNTLDGIRCDVASSTIATGFDCESNGRYGVYINRPYCNFQGYVEANATTNVYVGASGFEYFIVVRNVDNTASLFNSGMYYNQSGSGVFPSLYATGRMWNRGAFGTTNTTVTYSASMRIANDNGNTFLIVPTNGTGFTILGPDQSNYPQEITITIKNTFGVLGAATWGAAYKLSAWTNPANGFSRSITFTTDGFSAVWTQKSQTGVDVPN
tara:strand:+ start:1413 stop:2981 length:1569 start_codon:yes stop_codon:yes gene_type:complete